MPSRDLLSLRQQVEALQQQNALLEARLASHQQHDQDEYSTSCGHGTNSFWLDDRPRGVIRKEQEKLSAATGPWTANISLA